MSREVLTRPAVPPDQTVAYGAGPDQVVDLWRPRSGAADAFTATATATATAADSAPVPDLDLDLDPDPDLAPALVVVIHGGFWRAAFDRVHARPMANALADAGYVVAVPEYRRVGSPGGGGWPGTFDDIAAALDAVGELAAPLGADPGRTVWVGHSAGGHLALWAAARHRLAPDSPWHVAIPASETGSGFASAPAPGAASSSGPGGVGVVSLAGCTSLSLGWEWDEGDGAVANLLGGPPDAFPDRYAAADPSALLPLGVPVALVHGTQDRQVRVEMSRRYARAATEAGDAVTYAELPGRDHFDVIDPLSAAWPHVLAAIASVTPTPR